jgi:hypothetical protein
MIADDAFLRRLPSIIEQSQVVQIEALVFSTDAVEISMDRVRKISTSYREKICEAGRQVHVELLMHAWTVVDCINVVRQVLIALDYQTPAAITFLQKYECARKLRNKMDHLSGNAANVAKSKGRPPVFGALGYICVPDANLEMVDGRITATGGGIVTITAGRFEGGKIELVNPAGLELKVPTGGFRLDAFDEHLDLEGAAKDLRHLVIEINGNFEKKISEQAAVISKERDIPIAKLLSNPVGGLSFFLAFSAR